MIEYPNFEIGRFHEDQFSSIYRLLAELHSESGGGCCAAGYDKSRRFNAWLSSIQNYRAISNEGISYSTLLSFVRRPYDFRSHPLAQADTVVAFTHTSHTDVPDMAAIISVAKISDRDRLFDEMPLRRIITCLIL